ncbi:tRNA-binding protein [Actinocorallia longicatena]|uniref:tRNA-binding protein n=1 Tax=Actinocorallia longicatena TaxID=111803 RepID=A0ABP6QB32_9ACTN
MTVIAFEDFAKVDLRVGRVLAVEEFPEARKPSFKIQVDFGSEIGTLWTSAQAASDYTPEELKDRLVIGAVNLGSRRIAGFTSQFLLLGVKAEDGGLSLLEPGRGGAVGGNVY